MKPAIGIPENHLPAVGLEPNQLLADEFVLYTKTRNNHWNLLSLALIATFHIAQAQTVKKDEEKLIGESRRASNEALAKRDIEGFSKYWMKDFLQIRGNGTTLAGKDSITAFWKKMFKTNPETSYIRTPSEIIISNNYPDMAWETGTWTGINSYSRGGNYSAMWRKQDGVWKIQAELYVSLH